MQKLETEPASHNPPGKLAANYRWLILLGFLLYLGLFTVNSLTRLHLVEGDGFNYVDVGHNIATGQGITQSTLGFNETSFNVGDKIPAPLTAQPPAYPIVIALFNLTGLPAAIAALLVSSLCYGLVLLASYYLSDLLYGRKIALITVLALTLFDPLHYTSTEAWSESLGVAFIMASLYFTVRCVRSPAGWPRWAVLAGLTAGLAFATRYGLLPVFFVGGLTLINRAGWKQTIRRLAVYTAALAIPTGLVIANNLAVSGTLLGKDRLPSTQGLLQNLKDALGSTLGSFLPKILPTPLQFLLVGAVVAACLGSLLYRKKAGETLKAVFINNQSYILGLWSLSYLGLIIYLRTRTHFDNIYIRLAFPGAITLFILLVVLAVKSINFKPVLKYGPYLAALLLVGVIGREAVTFATTPPFNEQQAIARDNLAWATRNVTNRDLVIGTTEVVEVPYYIEGAKSLSFSAYPFNEYPSYTKITDYANTHCAEYSHIYILLVRQPGSMQQLESEYGGFVTDLWKDDLQKYPNLKPLTQQGLDDVFSMQCSPSPRSAGKAGGNLSPV